MTVEELLARPIGVYYGAVASGAPTPGGGSVAGVVAGLGAALGQMVVRLSEGKKACSEALPALLAAHDALARSAAAAFAAALADEQVYGRYRDAAALPRDTDEQKAERIAAIEAALVAATETPLTLCEACLDMLTAFETIAALGTIHAQSDARLGAYLAEAAVRGALLNVRGNAGMMKNREAAARYAVAADEVAARCAAGAAAVEAAVAGRS